MLFNLCFIRYSSLKDENIFLAEQLKTEIRKADNVKVSFLIMVPSFPIPDGYRL